MGRTLAILTTAASTLVCGCYFEGRDGYDGRYYESEGSYEGERTGTATPVDSYLPEPEGAAQLEIGEAWMSGDLGDARGFATAPFQVAAHRYGETDTLRFDGIDESSGMWVMAQVEVVGGLDHAMLEPGASLTLTPSYGGGSGVQVSGLGCSGPSVGNYTFDMTPTQVQVQVQSGSRPNSRSFVFELDFGTGHATEVGFEWTPSVEVPAGVQAVSATLRGTLEGAAVDGDVTWMSDLHTADRSTILLENGLVRTRVDVSGGLVSLAPGTYELTGDDWLSFAATTTPSEVDAGYSQKASRLTVDVVADGVDRTLFVVASFDSGDVLEAQVVLAGL